MADIERVDPPHVDPAQARATVAARREFYVHVVTFLLVGALLVALDLWGGSSGDTFLGLSWAYWPIGGWAIGLAVHAVWVFGVGAGWERRQPPRQYDEERPRRPSRFEPSDPR